MSTSSQESGSFSIQYADESSTDGPIYSDTVTLADGTITVTNQSFSPVTNSSSSFRWASSAAKLSSRRLI